MDDDYLKLYEAMNDRIADLSKSYRILNDHSHLQAVDIAKLDTKIDTAVSIVKWFISPIALLSLIIQLCVAFKVI